MPPIQVYEGCPRSSWTTAVTFSFFERLKLFYTKYSLNISESKTINFILIHCLLLPRHVSIVTVELHTGARENLVVYNKGSLY